MTVQVESPGRPAAASGALIQARVAMGIVLTAGLCALLGWFMAGPSGAGALGVISGALALIVRQPLRKIPAVPLGVVSPVCGQVLSAEAGHDPWLVRPALRVQLRVSPLDVHVLRCPVEGRVMERWRSRGGAWFRRRCAYWIRTDEGDDVVLVLILGIAAPAVRVLLDTGRRFGQGQACGYLYLAGGVDLYLPSGSRLHAAANSRVNDGSAMLAEFVHVSAAPALETG